MKQYPSILALIILSKFVCKWQIAAAEALVGAGAGVLAGAVIGECPCE